MIKTLILTKLLTAQCLHTLLLTQLSNRCTSVSYTHLDVYKRQYKDCPNKRFTLAGQTYPEPSPYDRLLLDPRVRFVGDAVAIVAGTSEAVVKQAMRPVSYTHLDVYKRQEKTLNA